MSRSWAHQADGQWVGQVYCDRMRCDVKHTWPVTTPPTMPTHSWRTTPEDRAARDEQAAAANDELNSHPLPDGWVVVIMQDSESPFNRSHQFHSAHCAALWLNARRTNHLAT